MTRVANAALAEQVSTSTAEAAAQQAISNGLATLAATVDDSASASSSSGATQNGASPSAMLANLQSALTTYEDSPTSSSAADAAVTAASQLATSLNSGAATVDQVREQADQDMASSVTTINSLLNQFTMANNAVVTGLASGANVASAEDQRDSLVTQLAQQVGVTTTIAANSSMSIYTDSGVTLFQDTPRTVAFTATPTLVDGVSGSPVTVDGVPITGANSPMPIQSGALAGYAALRDTLAPQYESQLDQIAGGLISAFAESDQSATPTLPSLARPLHHAGRDQLSPPRLPRPGSPPRSRSTRTSIRRRAETPRCCAMAAFRVPATRPIPTIRPARRATPRGLQQLVSAISATQSFDPSAGLGASASLSDYANASVSWLQAENQQASNASAYQSALATQAVFGAFERDRSQSRRRNDQHADPRKLLRLLGEASDHRQQHVLRPPQRRMTMSPNFRLEPISGEQPYPAGDAGAGATDDGDDRGDRPVNIPISAFSRATSPAMSCL